MIRVPATRRLLAGGVALAAVAVYANTLLNGFAYDDGAIIRDDARVHGLGQLGAIFSGPYWADYGRELGLYRPLTTLGFALQWAMGGGAPWVFHLGNILLHAAVCVLLFLLLDRLAGRAGAFLGALVFAVHPVHTEAVANIVGQAELWAALGTLAAALVWTRRPDRSAPRPATLAAVAGAYALAVFAKESAIVAPALLVALDLARERWSRREVLAYARRLAPAALVLALVAGAYLAARYAVIGSITGSDVAPSIPFIAREHFWIGLRAWPEYARLLFFPQDLSADYSPAVILPVHGWTVGTVMGAALLGSVLLLALETPFRPQVGLPAAWFFLSILVVSNLFFPIGVTLAERTLYLPSVALSLAAAFAWSPLRRRIRLPLLAGAVALALAACAARTWVRNPDWKDLDAVFDAMLRDHPESYRAQWSAAARDFERHDTLAADREWALAYRLYQGDARLITEYGGYQLGRGRPREALALLAQTLRMRPGDDRTRQLYATALVLVGRHADALAATDPMMPEWGGTPGVNDIRARAYMGLGDYPRAVEAWRRVVRAYPGTWAQWSGLARSLARTGDFAGAFAALDSARLRAGRDSAALQRIQGFRLLTEGEAAARRAARPPALRP